MTNATGIHPAPSEFSNVELNENPILQFFHYAHLPLVLRAISQPFCDLAGFIVRTLPRNAERSVALRKLLEAKDAAVRANLPAPTFKERAVKREDLPVGEPVQVGNHDEDRDGPVKFDG